MGLEAYSAGFNLASSYRRSPLELSAGREILFALKILEIFVCVISTLGTRDRKFQQALSARAECLFSKS